MKYKCLVLDHDDTAVKSTPDIHYPSFVEALNTLRPDEAVPTMEEFVQYCFEPGFSGLCKEIVKFTEAEYAQQQIIWKQYTEAHMPEFFQGFPEILKAHKAAGGLITVVSHSERSKIERDYQAQCGFLPDAIFGWELPEAKRKPHPYPLDEIISRFNLQADDLLMVDDSKPGMKMAYSREVDFAAAGWAHQIPMIKQFMEKEAQYYLKSVAQFGELVL